MRYDRIARFIAGPTFAFILGSCASQPPAQREPSADAPLSGVAAFPELTRGSDGMTAWIGNAILKTKSGLSKDDSVGRVLPAIQHYFLFLGLSETDLAKSDASTTPGTDPAVVAPDPVEAPTVVPKGDSADAEAREEVETVPSNVAAVRRLFNSSTQFLFCADLRDWDCLETPPLMTPGAKFRKESSPDLGKAVYGGRSLDMDVFFTQAWDGRSPSSGVVNELAKRIGANDVKKLSIAMYGIDDIGGTMKPVYDAIVSKNSRAVVDISGIEQRPVVAGVTQQWVLDYRTPTTPESQARWLFSPSASNAALMHATFQYDGTPALIRELNKSVTKPEDARVRVEWPTSHIMHNKYVVVENTAGKKAVWTGTANFSNHCMGGERNSNMSVYIRNDQVAQAFLDEFELMYNFDAQVSANSKSKMIMGDGATPPAIGSFHVNKYPVSRRHFYFDDGTRVRVHFAPTDDAEHRVILPMLYSAQAGDEIRISMFGGTGYEIVRALQYAVAKGASVRIVFDRQLGHGATSWIRDPRLNLGMANPYVDKVARARGVLPGKLEVRVSSWEGKNHYKAGTLVRRQKDGTMRAEQIIVGSQNWSSGGNDANDENLVSIQNLRAAVPAAVLFNREFDGHLWNFSRPDFASQQTQGTKPASR